MSMRVPQRIVIAPSGFKESLSPEQVCSAAATGIRRVLPGAIITSVPLVDGGEGSAATIAHATGGELVAARVTGPVGLPVDSHVARLGGASAGTWLVEMAAAAGLRLVPSEMRDPGATTTFGVGELIKVALDGGARRIIVGCGDSGTSDGGAGALVALGARLLDAAGHDVTPDGNHLAQIERIDASGLDDRLRGVQILVAGNMHNLLTGERGVARVFGPQKGATPQQVDDLDAGLVHWAKLLAEAFPHNVADRGINLLTGPGTGASGGLGAGLAAGAGAELRSRFDVLMNPELGGLDLDAHLANADLVFTAEGAVDYQTPRGKIPAEVARRAKLAGKPVIALAGSIDRGHTDVYDVGIDAVVGIIPVPMELSECVRRADELVSAAAERAMRLVLLGSAISAA